MVLDTFKDGIDAVLHPEKITKSAKTVGDGLALYYKFSVIPLVLLAIVAFGAGFVLQGVVAATGLVNGLLAGNLVWLAVVAVVLYVWGLIPIGLLIFSVILHWIGKGLGEWKGDFAATFTAAVYGMFLPLAILWLTVLPIIGGLIQLVAFVWSIYVLVVALANLHKTSRVGAFVVLVASAVVIWLVALWVATGVFGAVVGPLVSAMVGTLHANLPSVLHVGAA
jgi:hypothetical protein